MNATMKRFAKFTPVWAFVLAMGLAPSLWAKDAPDPQLVAEDAIDDVILDTRTVREIAVTDPAAVASEGLTFSASGWGAAAEGAAAISCTRNGGESLDFATGLAGDGVTNWTPVVNGTFVFTHTPDDEGGALTATYKVTGFTTTITVPADLDYNYGFSVSNRTTGAVYEAVENKFTVETGDDYDLIITPPPGYRFTDPNESGIVAYDYLTEAKTIAKGSLPAIEEVEYLHFTAVGGNVKIGMKKIGSPTSPALETATDKSGPWVKFTAGSTAINLADGETVYFRRSEPTPVGKLVGSTMHYWEFTMATNTPGTTVEAGGNVMSLLDRTGRSKVVETAAFYNLFNGCTALTTAPALPATNLAEHCYSGIFSGCTALTNAPALPAKELADSCYRDMFSGCASLTTSPALPATNLAAQCYLSMFSGCTSLVNAPALPAMELETSCYSSMFSDCKSLTDAPKLPATNLVSVYTCYACYLSMFSGCISLTNAPALPAMELDTSCYQGMFKGCTSLTTAPALPATNLAEYCYFEMFSGCESLTNAPALPAMKMEDSCYYSMFDGCMSLTTAPALPATKLAYCCYSDMFYDCTSLTTAPALPATKMEEECYSGMFYGCTSLTTAPALPATKMAEYCYDSMFYGCTSLTTAPALPFLPMGFESDCCCDMFADCTNLNSVTVGFTDWDDGYGTYEWLYNVAPTGVFLCPPELEIIRGNEDNYYSYIPEGWLVNPQTFSVKTPLPEHVTGYTMENLTDGSAIYTNGTDYAVSTNDQVKITLTPEEGYAFVSGDGSITATITGSGIVFGEEPYKFPEVYKQDYLSFTAHGGSVTIGMGLYGIDPPALETATDKNGPWVTFTAGSTTIDLADGDTVYFRRSIGTPTNLISEMDDRACSFTMTTNTLGATVEADGDVMSLIDRTGRSKTVGEYAFAYLFKGCSALTTAPEISATNLANNCYFHMFENCTSLTNAPALPAMELAEFCYDSMFYKCTSLTAAPMLPATNLATSCYYDMFEKCTSLTSAPALPAMELAVNCYWCMFYDCTSLTVAPMLPATNLELGCYSEMFCNCTSLNSVTVGFTDWVDSGFATDYWLDGVAPTGTFYCPPALEIKRGNDVIPNGWLVNPQAFSVATLPEGVELKPFNNLTEGSAIYTNTFGFTDYAASSNDLIELTFKAKDGYRFINGDDMLDSTVVTAKIDKTGYVIGTDIPFPTAARVYTIKLPESKQSTINAIYAVTNGTTDISDKGKSSTGMTSYTVVTGTTTTITFTPYVEDANGIPKKCFLRIPEGVTNPMVIEEISEDHAYNGYPTHETPYGVEAVDITIPGVSNMTYYVSNTTYAAETFYPEDCGVTNVFRIAKGEDTVFVFTPATGFRFKDETEAAKNPITVNENNDYTIPDEDIPLVARDMNTLQLAVIAGLDYVVTNKGSVVEGNLNGDYMEYAINRESNQADIYFQIKDGYTVLNDYDNPLSTNVTEDVVTIGADAPGMPKVVYWYKVQYTNGPETNKIDTVKQDAEYAISEDIYPKAGYTFLGWTNTEAEVAIYTNNQVVMNLTTTPGGTVTLTAVHQPNAYTVKYTDGAEGSAASNATYDVEFPIADNMFEKTGYTFQYWTNLTDNVGYVPGEVVSNLTAEADGEVELTAVWAANTYTLAYTPGDGTGETKYDTLTYDDETYSAIAKPGDFAKTGHTFSCWTNGTGRSFLPGEPVSNLTTVAFATNYFGAAWTANVHTVTMPADIGPMTYVVSNETTGAKITVTDNTFPASFGDAIKIYFTANSDYMLVGENTAYSFTVADEDKDISVGDLPCVSKLIIADWSDTVGVTNVEWNATNAVALINDKSKAVWVQFRYNFDDGSPIRETLPEGFGFRFEGGEGEGLPATFTTVPATSAALRKVSITGVLNTYCLTPLPADENYYIGDRLAYEAGAINAAPGGTNTEIKVEHAFIPVNPVVGVGTNAEDGCGIVTIVAEKIDHDDAAVVLLGENGVIKLLNYDEKGIITAPRGYEVHVEGDGEGYQVYTVGKIGVVSVTVNDEDPIALLDEDIPGFVAELEAKLVEDPFDLYCITFNDNVAEFGTLRNVSAGTFILLSGSWREVYAPEGETIGFAGGEVPAETVRVFMEGEGVQLMSETVVNGELASYVAVTSDYSIVVSNKLYLAGRIGLGDGAKLKLAKGGVIYAKGDIEALINAAEGCELVSSHDEYREWFIYVCRVAGATEVKIDESKTVTAADEIALAAILADSVVKPANDEVAEYLEKSGKFAEYQALFAFGYSPNEDGTYTVTPDLKVAVTNEVEASLNAAAAEIVHNLKAASVPVETKVGLYYGVKSGTEAGSLVGPGEWVMGTGGTVQLPFEAKGVSGFYKVEVKTYKAEAPQ